MVAGSQKSNKFGEKGLTVNESAPDAGLKGIWAHIFCLGRCSTQESGGVSSRKKGIIGINIKGKRHKRYKRAMFIWCQLAVRELRSSERVKFLPREHLGLRGYYKKVKPNAENYGAPVWQVHKF